MRSPPTPGRTSSAQPTTCSAVVLFATALFFAGMARKLRTQRLRVLLLAFGIVVLVGTVAWLATFPVSISVEAGRRSSPGPSLG